MAAVAKLKFVQGLTIGTAGQALFGVIGTEVTASNDTTTDVQTYTYELLDVPSGSTHTTGIKQDGGAPTWKFTPDVAGAYLVKLTVKDANGLASISILCFGIKATNGKFTPPFTGKGSSVNFDGQKRGWAKYVEEWLAPDDEIMFAVSDQATLTTFTRAGTPRKIDMNKYPPRVGDYVRKVYFVAVLENADHSLAYNAEVRLWDVTHDVLVAGTTLDNDAEPDRGIATEFKSAALTVGNAAGNIRNDATTMYRVEFRGVGTVPGGERVVLSGARLAIDYEPAP